MASGPSCWWVFSVHFLCSGLDVLLCAGPCITVGLTSKISLLRLQNMEWRLNGKIFTQCPELVPLWELVIYWRADRSKKELTGKCCNDTSSVQPGEGHRGEKRETPLHIFENDVEFGILFTLWRWEGSRWLVCNHQILGTTGCKTLMYSHSLNSQQSKVTRNSRRK